MSNKASPWWWHVLYYHLRSDNYAFSSPRNEHAVINNSPSWHSDPVWLLQNYQYNESPSGSILFQTCSFTSFGLKELKPSLKYLFLCVPQKKVIQISLERHVVNGDIFEDSVIEDLRSSSEHKLRYFYEIEEYDSLWRYIRSPLLIVLSLLLPFSQLKLLQLSNLTMNPSECPADKEKMEKKHWTPRTYVLPPPNVVFLSITYTTPCREIFQNVWIFTGGCSRVRLSASTSPRNPHLECVTHGRTT